MILQCSHQFIQLCAATNMTVPRDAFLTALCKACLPPKFALSLITTSHRTTTTKTVASSDGTSPEKTKGTSEGDPLVSGNIGPGAVEVGTGGGGVKKKLAYPPNDSVSGSAGGGRGGGGGGGGGGEGGKATTPISGQKGLQQHSAIVRHLQL